MKHAPMLSDEFLGSTGYGLGVEEDDYHKVLDLDEALSELSDDWSLEEEEMFDVEFMH